MEASRGLIVSLASWMQSTNSDTEDEPGNAPSRSHAGAMEQMAMPRALSILAALISAGAGLYLLSTESASDTPTIFDALMHGIGAYFIAKAFFMVASVFEQARSSDRLDRLREFVSDDDLAEPDGGDYSGLPPA
jgi:hypothetical protein